MPACCVHESRASLLNTSFHCHTCQFILESINLGSDIEERNSDSHLLSYRKSQLPISFLPNKLPINSHPLRELCVNIAASESNKNAQGDPLCGPLLFLFALLCSPLTSPGAPESKGQGKASSPSAWTGGVVWCLAPWLLCLSSTVGAVSVEFLESSPCPLCPSKPPFLFPALGFPPDLLQLKLLGCTGVLSSRQGPPPLQLCGHGWLTRWHVRVSAGSH